MSIHTWELQSLTKRKKDKKKSFPVTAHTWPHLHFCAAKGGEKTDDI